MDRMDIDETHPRRQTGDVSYGRTGVPARSVEGWVLMITGVHEEAHDEDLYEPFSEFGDIKNLHLNLDRQTGFVKGYAVIEYGDYEEALQAVRTMHGVEILGKEIQVDFAFADGPLQESRRSGR